MKQKTNVVAVDRKCRARSYNASVDRSSSSPRHRDRDRDRDRETVSASARQYRGDQQSKFVCLTPVQPPTCPDSHIRQSPVTLQLLHRSSAAAATSS
ncbi:hypothetical protein M378DRAFT_161722 [Amanita muscaria Koide BX008]|uniref:Uncharacterized protein n=1 Tax=Amanita muscaria (strain Koide BX008) TaxID=946122 RepID=A0A0C2SR13_AMAMK|nr:hypothetical protein M378DRAFT_161722 [Amanita muscaria Koide BX008]